MDRNRGPRGPVSLFAETDYRFGSGCLRMAVERIRWAEPLREDGETWYEVDGVELTGDGREVGRRRALVKASRLVLAAQKQPRLTAPTSRGNCSDLSLRPLRADDSGARTLQVPSNRPVGGRVHGHRRVQVSPQRGVGYRMPAGWSTSITAR